MFPTFPGFDGWVAGWVAGAPGFGAGPLDFCAGASAARAQITTDTPSSTTVARVLPAFMGVHSTNVLGPRATRCCRRAPPHAIIPGHEAPAGRTLVQHAPPSRLRQHYRSGR